MIKNNDKVNFHSEGKNRKGIVLTRRFSKSSRRHIASVISGNVLYIINVGKLRKRK